jgi:hypothetical protein
MMCSICRIGPASAFCTIAEAAGEVFVSEATAELAATAARTMTQQQQRTVRKRRDVKFTGFLLLHHQPPNTARMWALGILPDGMLYNGRRASAICSTKAPS